jgi:hypothetical protein
MRVKLTQRGHRLFSVLDPKATLERIQTFDALAGSPPLEAKLERLQVRARELLGTLKAIMVAREPAKLQRMALLELQSTPSGWRHTNYLPTM